MEPASRSCGHRLHRPLVPPLRVARADPIRSAATTRLAALLALSFGLGLTLGLFQPSGRAVYACSCPPTPTPGGPPPGPSQALDEAAAVFDGTVVEVVGVREAEEVYRFETRFVAHAAWKGVEHPTVTITRRHDTRFLDCGPSFRLGERYLVYADADDDALMANFCGRTRGYDATEAEALGPPMALSGAPDPWPTPEPSTCRECPAPPEPREALERYDAVFAGRLIRLSTKGPAEDWRVTAELENLGWWKGAREAIVSVEVPRDVWDCEWPWGDWDWELHPGVGDTVLFATRQADGSLRIDPCSPTARLDAAAVAEAVGTARAPGGAPDPATATVPATATATVPVAEHWTIALPITVKSEADRSAEEQLYVGRANPVNGSQRAGSVP